MRIWTFIFVLSIAGISCHSSCAQSNPSDLCAIVMQVASKETIDLGFESRLVGKCNAALVYAKLPQALIVAPGDYTCAQGWKIAVLTNDMLFAENVKFAVRLDNANYKRKRILVEYTILQFTHNKSSPDNEMTFSSGRIKISRSKPNN